MSNEKMNLYEKIINIRVEFQKNPPKATGNLNITQNQSFNYLELKDFLPKLNQLCAEYKIFNHISFSDNIATLKIIDIDDPKNEVVFETPFISNIQIGKCNAMQNCGGAQTYARRYLYYLAYDIQADDLSDYMSSRKIDNEKLEATLATEKQIISITKNLDKIKPQLKQDIRTKYNINTKADIRKLTKSDASKIISYIKNSIDISNPETSKTLEQFPECLQDNDQNDIFF